MVAGIQGIYIYGIYPEAFLVEEITESCSYIAPFLDKAFDCAFNFELSEYIIRAVNEEHHNNLVDFLLKTRTLYFNESTDAKDVIFLSNHDLEKAATRLNKAVFK